MEHDSIVSAEPTPSDHSVNLCHCDLCQSKRRKIAIQVHLVKVCNRLYPMKFISACKDSLHNEIIVLISFVFIYLEYNYI